MRQEVDSVLLARVMPKRATVPRGLWVLGRRVRRRVAESAGDLAVGGEQVLGELLFAWGLELVQESADADRADGASGGVEHRGTERRYVWGDVAAGDAVAPLPRLGEIGPKGVGVGDALTMLAGVGALSSDLSSAGSSSSSAKASRARGPAPRCSRWDPPTSSSKTRIAAVSASIVDESCWLPDRPMAGAVG